MRQKTDLRYQPRRRPCNLCEESYLAPSAFSRFCNKCKHSEAVHFADWLPDIDLIDVDELVPPDLTLAA